MNVPIDETRKLLTVEDLPYFNRDLFGSAVTLSGIGSGPIGGKASGLAHIRESLLSRVRGPEFGDVLLCIPTMTVIGTDVFDAFMRMNHLDDIALSESSTDRIAHAFHRADFPSEIIGDLRGLIEKVHTPLAVRSSSLLEDAMYRPFAGVYATKMIPNNQPDADSRFHLLVDAIKLVYASTFSKSAKDYLLAAGQEPGTEKMAVIVQEVIGRRHGERFYPDISGVARSYNFYPFGHPEPEDGVVSLALGLGRTIVDDGISWNYSPAYPSAVPPFNSTSDLLKRTQTEFWAVNMGKPPEHDPLRETEYLFRGNLADAELDGTLKQIASTYQSRNDRIVMGIGADGPRVLDFAPLLRLDEIPFTEVIQKMLEVSKRDTGVEVEIEFAVTIDPSSSPEVRFGFLQVRPMVVSHEKVEVGEEELAGEEVLLASETIMGNAAIADIQDIVYVKPERFQAKDTRQIAAELDEINRNALASDFKYLLIGFGRWGSSDPWLGIPVNWGQISATGVLVEATLPDMDVELSQGSHFFHNLSSFGVCYLSVHHAGRYQIDWSWLNRQPVVHETEFVRHVRPANPLQIRVDGKSRRGVILHG